MKIKISGDSTCDLSRELVEKYDVAVLPLHVSLGENDFLDGETIGPDDIYKYYAETKKLPKSGARSVEDYKQYFAELTANGDAVVHFNISDSMSSSHANAVAAAKEVGNVYVVDSQNLSTGTGLLMLYACDLAASGASAQEIVAKTEARRAAVQASFVVDTLEFLYKGGRCTSLVYYAANILGIKPAIEVSGGAMGVGKKYLGKLKNCVRKYVDDVMKKFNNPDKRRVFVTHTKMDREIVDSVIEQVRSYGVFDEILETYAGCTVTTHCGAGTLGVLFINDGGEQN